MTDASLTAISAKLEQLEDNTWKRIEFFSRKVSATEQRYSTYDRELLAIFAATKHFQHLLECKRVIVKTDPKSLTYAFKQKLDKASERQVRQLDFISQLTTDIVYVKGDENIVANALSRINAIDMPSTLTHQVIHQAQQDGDE